ncbi:hypothetical protein [Lacipirellula sp.]|uniref:hypothetical protein n=1 Tax=Lacipirellula sp. TaxID=2691419 RepID=UPI003D0EDF89
MHSLYCSHPVLVCFDNEGDDVAYNEAQQKRFNAALAEEKRKHRTQLTNTERQLAEISESKNLTEQELAEARQHLRVREENDRRESAKFKKEAAEQKKRADEIEARHNDAKITYALHDAAVAEDAYSPSILAQYLRGRTAMDDVGNIVVDLPGTDAEGKETVERLPPLDAVKKMKAQPDRFGGLFKDFVASKAALPTNKSGKVSVTSISTDEFMHLWKTNRSKLDL